MRKTIFLKLKLLGFILILYFIPILSLIFSTKTVMTAQSRWVLFSNGWGLAIFGSAVLYWILFRWEQNNTPKQSSDLEESVKEDEKHLQEQYLDLQNLLQVNLKEFEKMKEEHKLKEEFIYHLEQKLQEIQVNYKNEVEQKQKELTTLYHTINEQAALIEHHQDHIINLQDKERDLQYEIKTLLHFSKDVEITQPEPKVSRSKRALNN